MAKKNVSKKCCGKPMAKVSETADAKRDKVEQVWKCGKCGHRETMTTIDKIKD